MTTGLPAPPAPRATTPTPHRYFGDGTVLPFDPSRRRPTHKPSPRPQLTKAELAHKLAEAQLEGWNRRPFAVPAAAAAAAPAPAGRARPPSASATSKETFGLRW